MDPWGVCPLDDVGGKRSGAWGRRIQLTGQCRSERWSTSSIGLGLYQRLHLRRISKTRLDDRQLGHVMNDTRVSLGRTLTSRGIRYMLGVDGGSLVSLTPIPEYRSKPTQGCQLEHAHKSQSQPVSANYEWVEKPEQTEGGLLYTEPIPEIKV